VLAFFDALGEERCKQIEWVSADIAAWICGPIAERVPDAVRCVDPFHVVMLATEALDQVRREVWNEARRQGNLELARELKGARFAVWKNPRTSPPARPPSSRAFSARTPSCTARTCSRSSCARSTGSPPLQRHGSSTAG